MSKAEELLNAMTDPGISLLSIDPDTEPHAVIDKDRFIIVPEEIRKVAVQGDHNVETIVFDCPRYWDKHDMSEWDVYINYLRVDGGDGAYPADNVVVDENDDTIMHFEWVITQNASLSAGELAIMVCTEHLGESSLDTHHWHSEIGRDFYVSEGMDCNGGVKDIEPDLLAKWYKKIVDRVTADTTEAVMQNMGKPKIANISLLASAWTGNDPVYSQVVTVEGVTANSKLDIQVSPTQINELAVNDTALTVVNSEGVITVYAIGTCPTVDMDIQVEITEVEV